MRPIWSGTISFGLIHIPVSLYSGSKTRQLDFRYLRKKDLCPIKYMKICRRTGEEVPYEDLVRGYEYEKGDYVVLTDEDFKRADVKKNKTIEVSEFVDIEEIDKRAFEKPYYLEPAKEARKAYVLLRDALKKSNKAGIAKFVLRSKEHLATIMPVGDALVLEALRFKGEVRDPEGLHIPEKEEYSQKELDIAIQLIDQLSENFDYGKYKDEYIRELKKVIEEKAAGRETVPLEEEKPFEADVGDIMAKLKQSLEQARDKK